MSSSTLLSQLRSQLTVDVDSMDPAVAVRHTKDGQRFCDMTSNQGIAYAEASKPERAGILQAACQQAKASSLDTDEQIVNALDTLTVLFAKEVFPYLDGHVHAQTSPSAAYNTEKTIAHAEKLVARFEASGIPKSRVCIKIPATPESILACQYLQKNGINTLATCLFSLPQALAASQAGCLYIAPYFNELRVHVQPEIWKEYKNTREEHPMAAVIDSIVKAYEIIGATTLIMPASIVTPAEIIALAALRPHHLTISANILDQLASDTVTRLGSGITPGSVSNIGADHTQLHTNYLTNQASALKDAFAQDSESSRKMVDALSIFGDAEQNTKLLIRKQLAIV